MTVGAARSELLSRQAAAAPCCCGRPPPLSLPASTAACCCLLLLQETLQPTDLRLCAGQFYLCAGLSKILLILGRLQLYGVSYQVQNLTASKMPCEHFFRTEYSCGHSYR
jgi:hypothetical protein